MLVTNKQLSLGRSHSWDTLGGNDGQWDRTESVYEQQARVAARRNSLSYGEGGGWYESPPGVCPPDLDLKRDPYSHQDPLYGQGYPARHDPRVPRKGSVPNLNHYERPTMAHRGSIGHQDYYPIPHDPAMPPHQADGFFRGEHQPILPPPHPLSRSASHFGMIPGARAPSSPLPPPPPPPTAHEINRLYRDPGAVANSAAKMMPDGQRITSRAPSPAHYGTEHGSPRYASEPPPMNQVGYTDINGHPVDPQQPGAATCLVVDPACQGIIMRQETGAPYTIQQQQQLQQQQQQQLQQQQQQVHQQQLQQQQIQQHQLQQPLPPPPMSVYDPNLQMAAPLLPPPAAAQVAAPAPVNIQAAPAPPPPATALPPLPPLPPPPAPQTPAPVDPRKTDPEFVALLRNEGLSERTISSLIQQGFDSTGMLAVMEENDIRTVASNLGQARVLTRLALNCKRPPDSLPAPPQALAIEAQLMPPPNPGVMQTISPRMGDMMGRRPSSAPSQQLMEASGGYHGQAPRTPGPYMGAMLPVQPRPMSAYSQHPGMGMPMQMNGSMSAIPGSMHQLPQQMPLSMPALQQPPQQVPKAYSTNYTVPMELMKRDRNLPLSPMHSPHPSPQIIRQAGVPNCDGSVMALAGPIPGQGVLAANQKMSRRTGPPVIVSSLASPDISKTICFFCITQKHNLWVFNLLESIFNLALFQPLIRGWHNIGAHHFHVIYVFHLSNLIIFIPLFYMPVLQGSQNSASTIPIYYVVCAD